MENKIVNDIVNTELNKLGIKSGAPAKDVPVDKSARQTAMFDGDGAVVKISKVATVRTKTKPKSDSPEVLDKKMGAVFYALCGMNEEDFKKAHGKADAEISREKWEDVTNAIARLVGIVMSARGLKWKSGHEWSLERGDLVRHISEFVQENAVYRDDTGRNYQITVKK
jgi:hypothetical protein